MTVLFIQLAHQFYTTSDIASFEVLPIRRLYRINTKLESVVISDQSNQNVRS